jgi:hypothetical protein
MVRFAFALALMASPAAWAAENNTANVDPEEVVKKFASKEAEFSEARGNYTYRQTVRIQELDESGGVRGKYELVEDVIFSPDGKREEKVVRAPVSTLKNIIMTPDDEQDLRNVQPFVLTTTQIPEYHVRYLGREKVDDIPCFSFAVKPKAMEKGKRYFEGQIWVDDRDLQIVKTYGKGVGIIKKGTDAQFPKFETYREQVDGKYWFPTYTTANDTLHFQSGPQRIKMTVKYENYRRFEGKSTIKFGEVVEDKTSPNKPGEKPDEKPNEKQK